MNPWIDKLSTPTLRHAASKAVLATALLASVSACVPLVVGGGAVMGTMLAIDRRTTGSQVEDEGIELRTASRIRASIGEGSHLNVTSYNRRVLLTGEVMSEQDRLAAQEVAKLVENVHSVVNELVVAEASTLMQRSHDTLITGKLRAQLLDAKDLMAKAFKVVTERQVVYLMGRVTEREAQSATEIARSLDGVTKVVRVFELLSEDELQKLGQSPASVTLPAEGGAKP